MAALQLYRQSAVGDTLSDALHEMVAEDKIPGDLATKVMAEVASLASAHALVPSRNSARVRH